MPATASNQSIVFLASTISYDLSNDHGPSDSKFTPLVSELHFGR